mmetsp:Transcript_24593/g.55547  ORF Transcript_24593/g.55547 Transcript_24593/m.55547 type:complete len:264 (-) Transcript_24593:46-837(-)
MLGNSVLSAESSSSARRSNELEQLKARIPTSSISEMLSSYLPLSRESVYAAFAGIESYSPRLGVNQAGSDSDLKDSVRSIRSVDNALQEETVNEAADRSNEINKWPNCEELTKPAAGERDMIFPEKIESVDSHTTPQLEAGDNASEDGVCDTGNEAYDSNDGVEFSDDIDETMRRIKNSEILERNKEHIVRLVSNAKFFREAGYEGESLLDELMQQCSFLPEEQHSVRIALASRLFSHTGELAHPQEKLKNEKLMGDEDVSFA